MSVSFTTAAALAGELMEARDERRPLRLQKQLAGVKLLIIDELGFVPLSRTGAELLFELISQRYERGATMITGNLPFDEWTETFGTERLTGALLDRLTHHVVRRAGRPVYAECGRLGCGRHPATVPGFNPVQWLGSRPLRRRYPEQLTGAGDTDPAEQE